MNTGIFCTSMLVLIFGLTIVLAYYDSKEWQQFKQDHNCKVIAKSNGNYSTG